MLHGMDDGILGDLVEHDALDIDARLLSIQPQGRQQMPRDGLSLAVGVSGEQQGGGILELLLDELDMLFAFRKHVVFRLEVVFYVNRSLFAGKGAHMSVRGEDFVVLTEKFLDGPRFGGGFYDNEVL